MWIGFVLLGIGPSGVFLWTRQWTFGFHKRLVIYWLAERLLASQERLCSVELLLCSVLQVACFLKMIPTKPRIYKVGFEVLTAVITKMALFWDVAPCSLVEVYRFRGACSLHHQGDETSVNFCQTTRRKFPEGKSHSYSLPWDPEISPVFYLLVDFIRYKYPWTANGYYAHYSKQYSNQEPL
jgi:hypothetical protein